MVCQSCGKPKQNIFPRKSAIVKGYTFLQCEACREKRYEPRHLIIIVGRSKGPAAVRDHVVKRLYTGEEITAAELTP